MPPTTSTPPGRLFLARANDPDTEDVLAALDLLDAFWPLDRIAGVLKREPAWLKAEVETALMDEAAAAGPAH